MITLLFFSFLAGIVTVLSPCVLPVLPALLSAGAGKGHLRPIGIVSGLIFSFTLFTLSLTYLVHLTGISPDFLRYIGIFLIGAFGLMMLFPKLGDKFAEWTSGIANIGLKVQGKSSKLGTGFWSGFVLGIALGLVWTPCAGPILAAITTLVATSSVTWSAFWITLAYSLGAAIPMFLIIYGGQRFIGSFKKGSKYAEVIRRSFGALMILAAFLISQHYDVKLQQIAIEYLPFINIENNETVKNELDKLRTTTNPSFILPKEEPHLENNSLPVLTKAPELVGVTGWINTTPINLKNLSGKVVLIDFWTYSCINCIRTFPYLKDWYAKYKDQGFVIIGVHTPEFEFEKNQQNVEEAAKRFGLTYPIALDSNFKTWGNYNNHFWPAHYLIDQQGNVRSFHYGEGAYMETENSIRSLLNMAPLNVKEVAKEQRPLSSATYLGSARANPQDKVTLSGSWNRTPEKITSTSDESTLTLEFLATDVYLVMDAPTSNPVTVLLDNKPLDKAFYTPDMNDKGQILVKSPKKYDVLNLKNNYGRHTLTLLVPKGTSLYAFTFGD